jgi:hypothetical protein
MEELVAFMLAATVITLVQFVRVRDRHLLPLLLLFAFLAVGHARGEWDPLGRTCHYLAGGAGLALLFMMSPRPRR